MNPEQMREARHPISAVYNGTACANCMSPGTSTDTGATGVTIMPACSACKHARYCSKICQKNNWKEHKHMCKVLNSFRDLTRGDDPSISLPPCAGSLGLANAFSKFRTHSKKIEVTQGESILPRNMPKMKADKTWDVAHKFVQFCRMCSICQKSEYDVDVPKGESHGWRNCSRCQHGWTCSKEHWEIYQSQHTKEICDNYRQCTDTQRFKWNHIQNHGETFLFVPEESRSLNCKSRINMEAFPKGWSEYFQTRCPFQYAQARQGNLPQEFFKVATKELSKPVTCLYGIYLYEAYCKRQSAASQSIPVSKKKGDLAIHFVGSSQCFELEGGSATCVWEEIMHCLPSSKNANFVYVGPDAYCFEGKHLGKYCATASVETCPMCTERGRERILSFYGKTYHEYAADTEQFKPPDFVVAYNTGMHEEYTDSWKESLEVLLDMEVPCVFTSYNMAEAKADLALLQSVNADVWTGDHPLENPFAVDCPNLDVEVDKFFMCNQTLIGFKGRV